MEVVPLKLGPVRLFVRNTKGRSEPVVVWKNFRDDATSSWMGV